MQGKVSERPSTMRLYSSNTLHQRFSLKHEYVYDGLVYAMLDF